MTGIELLQAFASLCLAGLIALYLHTFYKFHQLVQAERPEWVDRKGSLSIFYRGFPRISDPNVTLAVIGIVLSSRVRELGSPVARAYAIRIRLLLAVIPSMFLLIVIADASRGA